MTTLTSDLQGAEEKHSWPQLVLSPQPPTPSSLGSTASLEVKLPPTCPGPDTTGVGVMQWFSELAPLSLLAPIWHLLKAYLYTDIHAREKQPRRTEDTASSAQDLSLAACQPAAETALSQGGLCPCLRAAVPGPCPSEKVGGSALSFSVPVPSLFF